MVKWKNKEVSEKSFYTLFWDQKAKWDNTNYHVIDGLYLGHVVLEIGLMNYELMLILLHSCSQGK